MHRWSGNAQLELRPEWRSSRKLNRGRTPTVGLCRSGGKPPSTKLLSQKQTENVESKTQSRTERDRVKGSGKSRLGANSQSTCVDREKTTSKDSKIQAPGEVTRRLVSIAETLSVGLKATSQKQTERNVEAQKQTETGEKIDFADRPRKEIEKRITKFGNETFLFEMKPADEAFPCSTEIKLVNAAILPPSTSTTSTPSTLPARKHRQENMV